MTHWFHHIFLKIINCCYDHFEPKLFFVILRHQVNDGLLFCLCLSVCLSVYLSVCLFLFLSILDHFLSFFGYLRGHTILVRLKNIEGQLKRYNPMIILSFYFLSFLFFFLSSHFDFHPLFINFRLFFGHFGGDHIIGVPPISVNFVQNDDKW